MTITPEEFSAEIAHHYETVYAVAGDKLDHISDRTQLETMLLALGLAGDIAGARVLDVGCGRGQLGRTALVFGAKQVVAFDSSKDAIAGLERLGEERLDARLGDLNVGEWPLRDDERFDVVFAVESLQYAYSVSGAIRRLWRHVEPGGRMVGVVCNRENRLVRDYEAQFYCYREAGGITAHGLNVCLRQLHGLTALRFFGVHFADDQTFSVFDPANREVFDPPAFRLAFAAVKGG